MRFDLSKAWLMASLKETRHRANRIVDDYDGYSLTSGGEGDRLLQLAKALLHVTKELK